MPAIATVPTFIAQTWRDALGLKVSPLPIEVPTHSVELSWTATNDGESGLQWLIGEMEAAFSQRKWEKRSLRREP